MKKLKCILIDDEPRNLELLTYYIEKYCPDLQIDAAFSERSKAEVYLKDEDNRSAVDILFLDLILDEGTGFDLLDQMDYADIHIVICTAHDEFALKAIQYEVVDYLLKPIEIQDLQQTIEKIKDKLKHDEKQVYDAEALSKFSNNGYGLDKPVIIKNKNAIELVSSKDIVL
jgi:two-component system LytT family response regulator